ncbi:hypothetical protein [Alkalispirochaeta alkalica]|uniref:hypothetical protein n=1 Tax=Alkalispirochaeta alkalica TaxID=46356 RepID=UPI00036E5744|nr:hypothetical protein [Alkalispirochaeta alkalica]
MNISELAGTLDLRLVQETYEDGPVQGAYTSDLLSDVMANASSADALITIQAHKNTIAVATLVGASAIIICNNRPVPQDMLDAAESEGIAIFVSDEDQFTLSGRLYNILKG